MNATRCLLSALRPFAFPALFSLLSLPLPCAAPFCSVLFLFVLLRLRCGCLFSCEWAPLFDFSSCVLPLRPFVFKWRRSSAAAPQQQQQQPHATKAHTRTKRTHRRHRQAQALPCSVPFAPSFPRPRDASVASHLCDRPVPLPADARPRSGQQPARRNTQRRR
jgi:hypothetical protein